MSFLWGAATSSHQVEGGNTLNDWADWEANGKTESKESSGGACDHWNRFREDLSLAKEMGLNAYRFSIEWSRLEPEEGHWDVAALEWYAELIGECERNGLVPMLTLHHFTQPRWLARRGGFTWSEASRHFAEFTNRVVKSIGHRVPLWCTLNEPLVLAIGQYLGLFMPPAHFHPESTSAALRGLLQSHVRAYDTIHARMPTRRGPNRHRKLAVGIAHNMMDFMPARHWQPFERLMSMVARRFYNQSFLDAVTGKKQHFGVAGLIPFAPQVEEALGRNTVDFIGLNYYTKATLKWRARGPGYETSELLPFGVSLGEPHESCSDLGWAVHPMGLGRLLKEVAGYGLPIYVTENGIADGKDKLRKDYLLSHLKQVAMAQDAGLDIRGYFHWSLLDNFEWTKGFSPRFGLIEVNYETQERRLRDSAKFLSHLINAHHGRRPEVKTLQSL